MPTCCSLFPRPSKMNYRSSAMIRGVAGRAFSPFLLFAFSPQHSRRSRKGLETRPYMLHAWLGFCLTSGFLWCAIQHAHPRTRCHESRGRRRLALDRRRAWGQKRLSDALRLSAPVGEQAPSIAADWRSIIPPNFGCLFTSTTRGTTYCKRLMQYAYVWWLLGLLLLSMCPV